MDLLRHEPEPSVLQAVVVHAGARDNYQLALALSEGGLLDKLVTNFYSTRVVRNRCGVSLPSERVIVSTKAAAAFAAMRALRGLNIHRASDRWLGIKARAVANKSRSAVVACSYYAFHAFQPGPARPAHRFLFQIHPHPETVRRTLVEELERVPESSDSLKSELELQLSQAAFAELAQEPALATGWLVASTHTARSLSENGVPFERIHIVPYGVDPVQFPARTTPPGESDPMTIMFLGSLVQRKGLSYLLDAVGRLSSRRLRLRLRGRGRVDWQLLSRYRHLDLDICVNSSTEAIVRDLQTSDLFVLPSLEEGFGHVLLEAMSCGVPVVTTDRTGGPDVVQEGVNGFVVPIRNAELLAQRIDWCAHHRKLLADMGVEAARRAREFTWERFRSAVRAAYAQMAVPAVSA